MQKKNFLFVLAVFFILNSCKLFHRTEKYGCPTDGKNVDAGKLSVDDPKAKADAKKAKKFNLEKAPITN